MRKKDILELKKRFKKDHCTFTKMCGCYVNGEKNILLKFRETFLNLEEDDYFKYLEIAKKVLSGTIGNNLLELNFELNEEFVNEKQMSFMQLKNSQLKDDSLLDNFYNSIIENYDYTGNFLILIFHDAYDIITKTKDNAKLDESEEVYEYILCAICPVELSKAGLRYFEEDNAIKSRTRDWIVEAPSNGFVFPAFINRSTDVNSIMYYTKNAKDTHPELMENALGCPSKQTNTEKKVLFNDIVRDALGPDEKKAEHFFMEIQESLNNKIEEHNIIHEDSDEPVILTNDIIQDILSESGVPEEITTEIEKSYNENFGDTPPLAEILIDNKALAAKAQKKKEEMLEKQVRILQNKLEIVQESLITSSEKSLEEAPTNSTELSSDLSTVNDIENDTVIAKTEDEIDSHIDININDTLEDTTEDLNADIVVKVNPEKVEQIETKIIDGKKYIVIPIDDNEQANVNGIETLL
ncbi:DUF4317 domain-containing protein [Clostridium celatum]|uniref:DUF4317 domain-containing protein n=1 Tax=Clostridium celatum TaxID=36834 RepID=UPI00189C1424|nr:DUF4317 domain-containing protein [Clostridium celatum]MDU2265897.1 DUF4317 domain-containing protein [Clostridium celatum]MDU3722852.1 DUF4317 domain-containing protein [Clostridium celatum]MDU6294271.1 DUF4317 domain-containing protein [Clostridium celatum]MDY3361762.1 DUF4317 domain-containing protein [Clostridium celatum]